MRSQQLQDTINEMTEESMKQLLLSLVNNASWAAILRYQDARQVVAEGGLKSIDAFKEPTRMARTQGYIGGLTDLEEAVNLLVEEAEEKRKEAEEAEKEGKNEE